MSETIRIACGDSECVLLPQTGGSIGRWRVGAQDMLRRALRNEDILSVSSFPLIPFSNRIADAQFEWNGKVIALSHSVLAAPHAHHGLGWQREWAIAEHSEDMALLRLDHTGDNDWPWPFTAEQRISVGERSLDLSLSVRNLASKRVPLAFGHHPYFDSAGATLRFNAAQFYPNGDDALPLDPRPIDASNDFSIGRSVNEHAFDNLFADWTGEAEIIWPARKFALRIGSDLSHALVYTPPGEDYFCFEPVSHITDALNRSDGDMPVILPGESYSARIRLSAVASPAGRRQRRS